MNGDRTVVDALGVLKSGVVVIVLAVVESRETSLVNRKMKEQVGD